MTNVRKLLLATAAALAGGIALAPAARAQVSGPGRFDPFHPELWLTAPDAPASTQPAAPAPAPAPDTAPAPGGPRPRPIIRDPLRPPTRSPFRP